MEARYARNMGALTESEQAALRAARVCVAGCGGLGGHIAELLARLGVGALTLCDGDSFEETNLNRQLLCTGATLGLNKAAAAAERVALIGGCETRVFSERLTDGSAGDILGGCDLAMDGLDSVEARRALARACDEKGIPLIHGAVSGWTAQVAVIPPGSGALERIYPGGEPGGGKSCLAFTPALCASLQCARAVKLLTGREQPGEVTMTLCDLLDGSFQSVRV